MLKITRSQQLFEQAQTLLPGGVNSPVRAFRGVGGTPRFIGRGEGSTLIDVDGNRYIDYVLSWGPLILGHAQPEIVAALQSAVANGTSYGAPNPYEVELAQLVTEMMPSIEMVRFVNSGTEATMSVLRLARAFTGREKIIKFNGNYHGHADYLLVAAGSGVATLGLPDSPGVPANTVSNTLSAEYNDLDAVAELFDRYPDEIAAIIVEPIVGNMGFVLPQIGFLEGLRELTSAHNSLLIFDEVMTGFRVDAGGAQAVYNIQPDLTALGKVIGGGLPVGAYGGRREIMQLIAPSGPVYQAGTLSGNPLAMVAGIETLKRLRDPLVWQHIDIIGDALLDGLHQAARSADIPLQLARVGGMFGFFFTNQPITNYVTAKKCDTERFGRFFHLMLDQGIYLPPSAFEACFLSTAHSLEDVAKTVDSAEQAFKAMTQ